MSLGHRSGNMGPWQRFWNHGEEDAGKMGGEYDGISPPETDDALINTRLPFMEIDVGIHNPEYQFLWKSMTPGKNGTYEKSGKNGTSR